ncbi:MAG: short-chain dehydrogenase/reductase [Microbacteriaceae bacterium]|nr:short-chain dehydrogenase/reductase [Microbacteriaceae bacterium]
MTAQAGDRVAIVTGASSGIGRATALKLAASGWTVALAARREPELDAVRQRIEDRGGRAFAIVADVGTLADTERIVATTLERTGRVDALINVAGIGDDSSIDLDDERLVQMLDVNLLAPARLMRAVIPVMRAAKSGAIVNIGSVAGEIGVNAAYSATKFGLRGLTDSVRREVVGSGIRVSLIEPGFIATEMTASRRGRMPQPGIVASAVERAIEHPRRRLIVPARYRVAVAFAKAFPAVVDRFSASGVGRD